MSKGMSFNNLNAEISNKDIISLWDDVVLGGFMERANFGDGIEIKSDNLVIDGNGHTIDARSKMRIFNISGENIILKNIYFKNGSTKRYGGAIRIKGSCKIINCIFENNSAKMGGDDISNGSEVCISNCKFSHEGSIFNAGSISTFKNEIEDLIPFVSNNVVIKPIIVPCNISFKVYDDENKPVADATLIIDEKNVLTNENGNCNIDGVTEGEYKVEVSAKGFKNYIGTVDVSSENTDFLVNLSRITHNVSFNVIDDDENKSLSGVPVNIAGKTAITDEYGNCSFEGIKEGINEVTVSAEGFEYFHDTKNVSSDNIHFPLILSRIAHNVSFNVINNGDKPVDGAVIDIGGKTGTTNENGNCIVGDVKGGNKRVKVSAEGYKNCVVHVEISSDKTDCSVVLSKLDTTYPCMDKRPFQAYYGTEPYIFTSYAHLDACEVFQELKRFHDWGLNIWYDEGITSGAGWREEVENAVIGSSLFIVFISNGAIESRNVRNEIFLAIGADIPIIPIYLEKTELKYGLRLELESVQSILKYSLPENQYLELCKRDFVLNGLDIID